VDALFLEDENAVFATDAVTPAFGSEMKFQKLRVTEHIQSAKRWAFGQERAVGCSAKLQVFPQRTW
jgi:hypothetical protein